MESSNLLDLLHASALEWNQDHPLLNGVEFTPSSREEDLIDPYFGSHMVQAQDLGFAKIKEELSEELASAIKPEEQTVLHEFSSYLPPPPLINGDFLDPLSFGMILPTENISSLYLPSMVPAPPQISLTMELQSLELLAPSARFVRSIAPCQSSNIHNSQIFDSMNYAIAHHLQDSAHGSSISLHKIPPSVNGVPESKRANCNRTDQPKASQGAPKKPRFESRPSLSPFKVRKEKLGDRIAALQQLVAPFGKTDTASVLMEAIGYIKFLQDQVETLSVPYMRPSNNKKLRTTEGASDDEKENPKPDLRSRGLCLVPLTCTSYVTNIENAVWSPPNFMGGT